MLTRDKETSDPKEYNTDGFKRIEGWIKTLLTFGTRTVLLILKTVRSQVDSGFQSYSADFRVYSYQNRCENRV